MQEFPNTPVLVDRANGTDTIDPHITVWCNVGWARLITQALADSRDHAITCEECGGMEAAGRHANMIAEFDSVFMHVDDDGDHEVRLTGHTTQYICDGGWFVEVNVAEAMLGSAMLDVLRAPAYDDFVCHDDGGTVYMYDVEEVAT